MNTEPTLGEVMRTLKRVEEVLSRRMEELSARFDRLVTLDVYEAHRSATNERIAAAAKEIDELREELDKERSERRADRRVMIGSALTAVLSLLVTITGAFLVAALGLN